MTAEIEVYEDEAGEWRWRLKAGNGETIADGSEGYDSRYNAERAVDTVRAAFGEAAS